MTFFDNKISLRTAYFARRRRAKYTLYAQSVFCDVHAAAKNEFHFFRGLRAANSARHLFDRVTKTFAKNPDLRNFTLDNSRICTYNKKADCSDACVAQLVEQLTRNEQVAGSSPATSSKKPGPWTWFFSFCPRAYKARQTFLKVRRALAVIAPVILKSARGLCNPVLLLDFRDKRTDSHACCAPSE